MNKQKYIGIALLGIILLVGLIFLTDQRSINITINNQTHTIQTRAFRVGTILKNAGIQIRAEDIVEPAEDQWILADGQILIEQAQDYRFHFWPEDRLITQTTVNRNVAAVLQEAGINLGPQDRILVNGSPIGVDADFPRQPVLQVEVRQAVQIILFEDGIEKSINSSAFTVGEALYEAGYQIQTADEVSIPLDQSLDGPVEIRLDRATPVKLQVDNQELVRFTAAESVGEALADSGIVLQGLDFSVPSEDQPIPIDQTIKIVRVREEITLAQNPIPFQNTYEPSPQVELDQRQVITPGEYGIEVSRVRVRYEDGVEVARITDSQWRAKEPQNQVVGYGTNPVVKTIDTPQGTLEYWRAVNVYATSYSPCRLGVPGLCNDRTASGINVTRGVVAVTRAWYSWMAGQRVYIPGYGTAVIADVGGGIPGRYWVDLGYTDADYQQWSSNVTMYFLTPVPANIPWILP